MQKKRKSITTISAMLPILCMQIRNTKVNYQMEAIHRFNYPFQVLEELSVFWE